MVIYAICNFPWFKINIVPSLDGSSARSSGKNHTPAAQISSWAQPGCTGHVGSLGGLPVNVPLNGCFSHICSTFI